MSDVIRSGGGAGGGKDVALSDSKALRKEPTHPTILEFESPTRSLISLPIPMSARIVAPLIAGVVVCTTIALAVIPIDIVVTAPGKLSSKSGTFVVQPLDTSIVRRINVHEGEAVKAGQILATLDPTLAAADVSALQSSVKSLTAEVDRLQAEAGGKQYVATSNDPSQRLEAVLFGQRAAQHQALLDSYREKISSLETQIAGNLAMANFYRQRLAVAQTVEDLRAQLEKLQVGSRLNSLAAVDNRLEMQRNMVSAEASAATEKVNLQEMIAERDQDGQKWNAQISQDLTDQGRKLSDAREQLTKANLHSALVDLRAPEDAIVLSVSHVSVGSVLQSGDQFITLTPADAPLDAEVYIMGTDAGWPHVGDVATVKLNAFTFTLYGYASGLVRIISPDSFTSADQAGAGVGDPGKMNLRNSPNTPQPVAYRATVSLDKLSFHNMPPDFRLRPGMPVTADIKVGKRTMLAYILGNVVPAFSEGMREP